MFLSPYMKNSLPAGCFLKARLISSANTLEFIQSGTYMTGQVPEYWVSHLSNSICADLKFLEIFLSLCFFIS